MTTYLPENVIERVGNMFDTELPAIGHGVNVDGKMGAGVAKLIRQQFPEVYHRYAAACAEGTLRPGGMLALQGADGTWVLNLASQDRPGANASLAWLRSALIEAFEFAEANMLAGFAIPRIGAGIGGLEWADVITLINRVATQYPGVIVEVWSLPTADDKPLGSEYEQLIEALQIFLRYSPNKALATTVESLYAGPDPSVVSVEDLSRLRLLGWRVDRWDEGFVRGY